MPWLKRSVVGIGRAIGQAVSRQYWLCHGIGSQLSALALPWLKRSVAGIGRAMGQAVSRQH